MRYCILLNMKIAISMLWSSCHAAPNLSLCKYMWNKRILLLFFTLYLFTCNVCSQDTVFVTYQTQCDYSNSNFRIICDNASGEGVASAYTSHQFRVIPNDKVLQYSWKYELPLVNGGYVTIQRSQDEVFTIPPIDKEYLYKLTTDGEIKARVTCLIKNHSITITCSYNLTLELKPKILGCQIIKAQPCDYDNSYYDVQVGINYCGGNGIRLEVDNGSPIEKDYYSNVPYYANIEIKDLDTWNDCVATAYVSNAYGGDTLQIRLDTVWKTPLNASSGNYVFPHYVVIKDKNVNVFFNRDRKNARWASYIYVKDFTRKYKWERYDTDTAVYYSLMARPEAFPWHYAVIRYDASNHHCYIDGIVVCSTKERCDTAKVVFDLLPTKPIINNVAFEYDSFDYADGDFVNPLLHLDIQTERYRELWFLTTTGFEGPSEDFSILYNADVDSLKNGHLFVSSPFGWDQKFCVLARNDFGLSLPSDTVLTSDYIRDQNIHNYFNQASSVSGVRNMAESTFRLIGGRIVFSCRQSYIRIYNTQGQLISQNNNSEYIDVSNIGSGIYVLQSRNPKGLIKRKIAL